MNEPKFDLKKIKINPDGKVEISYKSENGEEGRASYDEIVVISDRWPHPDLREAIKKLNVFLADANGLRPYRNLPHIPPGKIEKWNQKEIQDILEVLDNHVYAGVEASGIALYGKDHDLGVIITGKHQTKTSAVAMNSPKLRVNGDSFGFEASVFDVVDEIVEEARKFVFDKKSAQMQMEFPAGEEGATTDAENGNKKKSASKKKAS